MNFLQVIEQRRSINPLDATYLQPKEELIASLQSILTYTPSSFNKQTQRMVLLLEHSHQQFWDLVIYAIQRIVPVEQFERSKAKISLFRNSLGTVLFFDDTYATKALGNQFPLYQDSVETWSVEQNGMLQINVWNGLVSLGYQANLQHYTELIEEQTKEAFLIPSHWKMMGQMPFGVAKIAPNLKEYIPLVNRFLVRD
jgi:predicted oxidoreductase (fatty acid repression mutant protein)